MFHRRSRFWINVVSAAAVVVFVLLCGMTIIWANGLKFNLNTYTFETTALISIESSLDNVNVYSNGELVGTKTPLQLRKLSAGYYAIKITKTGYYDYVKNFQLASNGVGVIDNLVLIAKNPTVTALNQDTAPHYVVYPTFDTGLSVSNGELFDGNKFITRFSQEPIQIHRFNTGYVYQVGQEIRLFLPTSNLDSLLYATTETGAAKILTRSSSWTIFVYEGSDIKQIEVIKPSAG